MKHFFGKLVWRQPAKQDETRPDWSVLLALIDPDANAALDEWRRLGGRPDPAAPAPAAPPAPPAASPGEIAAFLRALAAIFAWR
ncbi:hypothetical protein [Amaricoccus solimangrovi]|uniref:hypothetical protein n=1 Tax=Amaricoccus solimangrovi TaxID=2589815 RepID=UPI0015E3B27A|nr:hypothetical protein [Amaricoccus solimangrovi]